MSTTSVKLPDALKRRAASLAKKKGISMHAFLVNAIEETTAAEEAKGRLVKAAKTALTEMRRSGKGYVADGVHTHISDRIAHRKTTRPKAKTWQNNLC